MKIRTGPELPASTAPRRRQPTATPADANGVPPGHQPLVPDTPRTGGRPANAKELAWLAALAYMPMRSAASTLTSRGFTEVLPFSRWRTGTQGMLALKNRRAVIAFRGSESTLDWLIDIFFVPWGRPPRHLGFQCAWWSVRRSVHAYLDARRERFDTLKLCGHSLGGAIAKVAAFELASKFSIAAVVTLGAPRVFWGRGVREYDEAKTGDGLLGDRTLSYVNGADIVATLPPALLGYCHTKGAQASESDPSDGWTADLLARIKQRQELTGFASPMPPRLPEVWRVSRIEERPVLDFMAGAYCRLERWPLAKSLTMNLLAPIGLFVAYLWILWLIGGASISHKLGLYRTEFFGGTLMADPFALPTPPVAARIGGLIVMLPVLALGLFVAWKLALFSWLFLGWGWQTTVTLIRQLV